MKILRENNVYTPWSAGFISFSLFVLIFTIPAGIALGIIRNLIERSENKKLGDNYDFIKISKSGFNIRDKEGLTYIPFKDILKVTGGRKVETSLSGVRMATTTYSFGKLTIITNERRFTFRKVAYVHQVILFLNYILANPNVLQFIEDFDRDEITILMYSVFAEAYSYNYQHFFGKKAKEEEARQHEDFIAKINAVLAES